MWHRSGNFRTEYLMTIDESPFFRHFSVIPDPRVTRGQKHLLTDMIAIAIIAALCCYRSIPLRLLSVLRFNPNETLSALI